MSNLKRNTFDATSNPRDRYRNKTPVEDDDEKPLEVAKPVPTKPAQPTTYYRALPTASGYKLNQQMVQQLVDMGFDKQNSVQALQESDNDLHAGKLSAQFFTPKYLRYF